MSRRSSAWIWLYRALSALLPARARADREEMIRAYDELLSDRRVAWSVAARGVLGLLSVLGVEWLERLVLLRARRSRSSPSALDPGNRPREGSALMALSQHARHAVRTLRKAPVFSITSALLLAIGIGATTTIFTIVDHVLLRPLPYPGADRLIGLDEGAFSGPYFRALETLESVELWGGAWTERANLVGEGEPLQIQQTKVTERFFELFGASAARGRLLAEDDFAAPAVAVLDAGAWQRIWGGDPSVVGRTIRIDGEAVTVVGIVDAGFALPEATVGGSVDVWRPLDWSDERSGRHTSSFLQIAGRLAEGIDVAAAQAEVDALGDRMTLVHENYLREGARRNVPVLELASLTVQRVRTGLGLLMGAVTLLLLVACANVASLFLARALGRTREMAVRRALGAGRASVIGQLLMESVFVGVGGCAVGVGLAWCGVRGFVALNPTALPRQSAVAMDPQIMAFAILASLLTSVLFGLLPALHSVRGELSDELRGGGRSSTAARGPALLRSALVSGEIALSLVLLSGAGLLLRSFLTVRAQDPGFALEQVWTVSVNLPQLETPAEYVSTMDRVLTQVQALPGVEHAAYGLTVPLQWTGGSTCCWGGRVALPGREDDGAQGAMVHPVSTDYLVTFDVDLIAGRAWTAGEPLGDPVPIVVSETLARKLVASPEEIVGAHLTLNPLPSVVVVGVAEDSRHYGLDQEPGNQVYVPVERLPFPDTYSAIAMRVAPGAETETVGALREAIWAAAPTLPLTGVRSMRESLGVSTSGRRFDTLIFGAFAAMALALAAGGLYGTLLYIAGQRKRELGIRVALGASRRRLEAQMIGVAGRLASLGVAVGSIASWFAGRYLESRIWGIERSDPLTLAGAAAVLLLIAVVASWGPARRAGRSDPLELLRVE